MRRQRSALATPALRAASEAVCQHVADLPAFGRARAIALYAASSGEIDVAPLAQLMRARGGLTYLPRIAAADPPALSFHRVDELAALPTGPLGIPTPPAEAPSDPLDAVDLVLVPGLAFDLTGQRLGFGRGYYDAALAAATRPLRIGVCHPFQLVDAVPRSEHDQPVDILVTPDGARATGARPFVEAYS